MVERRNIDIKEEIWRKISVIAAERGRTKKDIVNEFLESQVELYENMTKVYKELVKEHGEETVKKETQELIKKYKEYLCG